MNNIENIERALVASILSQEIEFILDDNYFTNPLCRKLVKGANRLRELGEPMDFELLRNKFIKANKWSYSEDEELLKIVTFTTPFSSNKLFEAYYNIIQSNYRYSLDRRLAI